MKRNENEALNILYKPMHWPSYDNIIAIDKLYFKIDYLKKWHNVKRNTASLLG